MDQMHSDSLTMTMRVLRTYLRTGLRGSTRLTNLFAEKLESLQFVPITIDDCAPLYIDMRHGHHELLRDTPYTEVPWERGEQRVMKHFVKPGDVAFDIGANIGMHSVLLSKLIGPTGHLYAFEPNRELLPQLERTIAGLTNATLFPIALSDVTEEASLFVPLDAMKSSLANWTVIRDDQEKVHVVECSVRRMDDLLQQGEVQPPDFIKCDVEGAELMVFKGGILAIDRENAPILLFEANAYTVEGFDIELDSAIRFLSGLGSPNYSFYSVEQDGSLAKSETLNSVHTNLLAIPYSKRSRLESFPY